MLQNYPKQMFYLILQTKNTFHYLSINKILKLPENRHKMYFDSLLLCVFSQTFQNNHISLRLQHLLTLLVNQQQKLDFSVQP